ncbi:MAG: hypothetical protein LBK54_06000 [Propionibacteriaceae bacterium]|jgi:hypothetical protein|nr:hypothetical protein [Propionibacteriaceae bacterium]
MANRDAGPNGRAGKKAAAARPLKIGFAATLALALLLGAAACESGPAAAPGTAQAGDIGPSVGGDEGNDAQIDQSDDETNNPDSELNGHTQEEYDRMKEHADEKAQDLLDAAWSTETLAIKVFPPEVPDGYYVIYRDSRDNKANLVTFSPSGNILSYPNLSQYNH